MSRSRLLKWGCWIGPLGFRNCEDIIIAAPGIAYTSCDPARDYDNMVMDVHRPKEREEQGHVWRIDYMSASNKECLHGNAIPIVTNRI